jgi:hypothetical protein
VICEAIQTLARAETGGSTSPNAFDVVSDLVGIARSGRGDLCVRRYGSRAASCAHEQAMILVDAGPLIALLDAAADHREACVATMRKVREPLLTEWSAVTEAMHVLAFSSEAQARLASGEAFDFAQQRRLARTALASKPLPGAMANVMGSARRPQRRPSHVRWCRPSAH